VPEEKTFVGKISIPPGYAIQEIPASKVIAIPGNGIRCVFNFSRVGDQVQILTRLQINRTYFNSEEFEGLREFYARVVAKKAEQIVLRKL